MTIKPLQIKNLSFPINVIQGPLAGVSCAPFRQLIWEYSQPAFSCTEMISCKTLIHQPIYFQQRFIKKHPNEGPVCFQLAGENPSELGEAVNRVTDLGADLIDLNCGCPVKKIRKKGAGSKLLSEPLILSNLLKTMRENTHLPISIKIRVDGGSNETNNREIVKVIKDSGIDFLIVHGRHWTEHYETPCRYDEIQFFVNELNIPVIGNGDIACVNSLKKMFTTGCAGAMVSRASVGQPWLIKKMMAELNGEKFDIPGWLERNNTFIRHVEELIALLGDEKKAILQARKLAKYYARGLKLRDSFCDEINHCAQLNELKEITFRYFQTA